MKIEKPKVKKVVTTPVGNLRYGETFRYLNSEDLYMVCSLASTVCVAIIEETAQRVVVVNLENGQITAPTEQQVVVKVVIESKLKGDAE